MLNQNSEKAKMSTIDLKVKNRLNVLKTKES